MGVPELIGSLLSILVVLLPVILAHVSERKKETDALTRKSVDELHLGVDRVRQAPPV